MPASAMVIGCAALIVMGARAAAETPGVCTRDKLSAAARAVQERMECQVAAVRAGGAVDDACVQRAMGRLVASFERADRRGPCPGMAFPILQTIELEISELRRRMQGSGGCPARKLTAAGRNVARRLRCRARDAARVLECFARTEVRFVAGFDRAERRGPCDGDAGTVDSVAEGFASSVATPIAGAPPSTTSTTTSTLPGSCGNGGVDPGEECDGQSYCTGECRLGSTACCIGSAEQAFCIDVRPSRQTCLSCFSAGGVCATGLCSGLACVDGPIAPVAVCCQFPFGGCETNVATSIGELGSLYWSCAGEGFPFGLGTCGVDGVCHPGG